MFRSRTVNKKICEQYDGIVTRITTIPDNTEELVTLMKFLEKLELKELLDLKVRPKKFYFSQTRFIRNISPVGCFETFFCPHFESSFS